MADVFSALAENRPYRDRFSLDKAVSVMREMAADGSLDAKIVGSLEEAAREAFELVRR
ncbi:MAG: hypothetical protein RIN56_07405 [Sporomusaceae bacterium]|nr:hypothetical protein [Sporomusaceae bacterium]